MSGDSVIEGSCSHYAMNPLIIQTLSATVLFLREECDVQYPDGEWKQGAALCYPL